jgi:hypothetical protein
MTEKTSVFKISGRERILERSASNEIPESMLIQWRGPLRYETSLATKNKMATKKNMYSIISAHPTMPAFRPFKKKHTILMLPSRTAQSSPSKWAWLGLHREREMFIGGSFGD